MNKEELVDILSEFKMFDKDELIEKYLKYKVGSLHDVNAEAYKMIQQWVENEDDFKTIIHVIDHKTKNDTFTNMILYNDSLS